MDRYRPWDRTRCRLAERDPSSTGKTLKQCFSEISQRTAPAVGDGSRDGCIENRGTSVVATAFLDIKERCSNNRFKLLEFLWLNPTGIYKVQLSSSDIRSRSGGRHSIKQSVYVD